MVLATVRSYVASLDQICQENGFYRGYKQAFKKVIPTGSIGENSGFTKEGVIQNFVAVICDGSDGTPVPDEWEVCSKVLISYELRNDRSDAPGEIVPGASLAHMITKTCSRPVRLSAIEQRPGIFVTGPAVGEYISLSYQAGANERVTWMYRSIGPRVRFLICPESARGNAEASCYDSGQTVPRDGDGSALKDPGSPGAAYLEVPSKSALQMVANSPLWFLRIQDDQNHSVFGDSGVFRIY